MVHAVDQIYMKSINHQTNQNPNATRSGGYKRVLILSLILNLCFCIGGCIFVYYKRDKIVARFGLATSNPTQDVLSKFNNKPLSVFQDSIITGSTRTLSFMFLGNSITRHGITDFWDHECGMAASVEEKDYVHQLVAMVAKEKQVNVKYSVCNIAEFERSFASSNFDWNIILSQSDIKTPDYVIVQIGENMAEKDIEIHERILRSKYIELLNNFANSTCIITLPYWLSSKKNYVFTDIAIATNSYIADLSHLGSDPNSNNASSEKDYNHPGVGVHPGDKGMKRIADVLFSVINTK